MSNLPLPIRLKKAEEKNELLQKRIAELTSSVTTGTIPAWLIVEQSELMKELLMTILLTVYGDDDTPPYIKQRCPLWAEAFSIYTADDTFNEMFKEVKDGPQSRSG